MLGLLDVKGKNIIDPLPKKPAEVRSENRTNPKEAKVEHLLKAIRTFSATIECDNTRRALLAITLDARF